MMLEADQQEWVNVTLGIIGGAITILVALGKGWPRVREAWKSSIKKTAQTKSFNETTRNFRRMLAIESAMRCWLEEHNAQRVLFLHARDSGKPWTLDKPVKCNCLTQKIADHEPNTTERWREWEIDLEYRKFLGNVLDAMEGNKDGGRLLIQANMSDSVLKDAYEEQGTCASVVFGFEWTDKSELLYVSLNFGRYPNKGSHPISDEERRVYEKRARNLYERRDQVRQMVMEARHAWTLK